MIELARKFIHDNRRPDALFVLKGFALPALGAPTPDLHKTIQNKIGRLVALTTQENQIINFDEFICLYDMVVAQYKKIFILENSLYLNLYPLDSGLSQQTVEALADHFNEDVDEDTPIGDLTEYTNMYSNVVPAEQGYACCYNLDAARLRHEKIEIRAFAPDTGTLNAGIDLPADIPYMVLCDDMDYYQLVQLLANTDIKFSVTWENYLSGKDKMQQKLDLLSGAYPGRLFARAASRPIGKKKANEAALAILNRYWSYSSFRDIKVYDLSEAEQKRKKVISVSQETIIADLIEQVEHCRNGENFRDIFVTAPTGAGKSLIFQIPAIHIAEQYNLVTLVITPLIGLMNDQVQALAGRGYEGTRTIHSDISPVIKQEIFEEVASGKCHILYLSPESLLSRSDVEQIIGTRKIGMLVVDEAHIVTTWGKQFRPDYWYLGDHVRKLRRAQSRRQEDPSPFIIATFTATAIYEGREDMYHETINSLHMIDPITYLGYIKRENIAIEISEVEMKRNKIEYEINKFDALIETINTALTRSQKTLVYFPTVALINRFHDYCYSKDLGKYVGKYHGQMDAAAKEESHQAFLNAERPVMLATKAFGMGIDIPDIAVVSHFAPTGNVCDYMQEIGRAARREDIEGHAVYKHMGNDFKHINRLHGLSAIQTYQLVEVIKKVLEIYTNTRYRSGGKTFTKRRNELLVDAESFAYIFDGPYADENTLINKVKTAMLLIQKDYENRGYAPFAVRPIPLFAYGFLAISQQNRTRLHARYGKVAELVDPVQDVCKVNLKKIWEKAYQGQMSFPKFKFLLYTKSDELDLNLSYSFFSAMCVKLKLEADSDGRFRKLMQLLKSIIHASIVQAMHRSLDDMCDILCRDLAVSRLKAENMINVMLAAMDTYAKLYSRRMNRQMYSPRITGTGKASYAFSNATNDFFTWIGKGYGGILENSRENTLYIVNEPGRDRCKETLTILGFLEAMEILHFESLGGSNSQIDIYVNETKSMQMVRDRPHRYRNHLLELVNERHTESVRMLTFLFQNRFTSDEIWEHLENYFLGLLPAELDGQKGGTVDREALEELPLRLVLGQRLGEKVLSWQEVGASLPSPIIASLDGEDIPMADYLDAKLMMGEQIIDAHLVWQEAKVIVSGGGESEDLRTLSRQGGWRCIPIHQLTVQSLRSCLKE